MGKQKKFLKRKRNEKAEEQALVVDKEEKAIEPSIVNSTLITTPGVTLIEASGSAIKTIGTSIRVPNTTSSQSFHLTLSHYKKLTCEASAKSTTTQLVGLKDALCDNDNDSRIMSNAFIFVKREAKSYKLGRYDAFDRDKIHKAVLAYLKEHGLSLVDLTELLKPRTLKEVKFKKGDALYDFYRTVHHSSSLNRSMDSVLQYIRRHYRNVESKGEFTREDDETLERLYQLHSGVWVTMEAEMGRADLRKRWNILQKRRGTKKWDRKKDLVLLKILKMSLDPKNPTAEFKWTKVAKELSVALNEVITVVFLKGRWHQYVAAAPESKQVSHRKIVKYTRKTTKAMAKESVEEINGEEMVTEVYPKKNLFKSAEFVGSSDSDN